MAEGTPSTSRDSRGRGAPAAPTHEELVLALAGAMDETAEKSIRHAASLREQGERLLRMASDLERQATKLYAGAEALGGEIGFASDEIEDTTVNSRGEVVSFEVARDTARGLGRFELAAFGEALALKPIKARTWLSRLRERGILDVIEVDGQPVYDFVTVDGTAPGRERQETPEDAARRLVGDLADERGETVPHTGRDAQKKKSMRDRHNQPGRRRPGRT